MHNPEDSGMQSVYSLNRYSRRILTSAKSCIGSLQTEQTGDDIVDTFSRCEIVKRSRGGNLEGD